MVLSSRVSLVLKSLRFASALEGPISSAVSGLSPVRHPSYAGLFLSASTNPVAILSRKFSTVQDSGSQENLGQVQPEVVLESAVSPHEPVDWISLKKAASEVPDISQLPPGYVKLSMCHKMDPTLETTGIVVEYVDMNRRHLGIVNKYLNKKRWSVMSLRNQEAKVLESQIYFQFPQEKTSAYTPADLIEMSAKGAKMLDELKQKIHPVWNQFLNAERFTVDDVAKHLYGPTPSIDQYYASHCFLMENWSHFQRISRVNYRCRSRDDAAIRMRQSLSLASKQIVMRVKDRTLDMFILRLCQRLKEYEKKAPVAFQYKSTERYLMEKLKPTPKEIEWNDKRDEAFIGALINYAIEDPYISIPDYNVYDRVLSKFGVGTRAIDAIVFCQQTGIMTRHQNIHLLRNPLPEYTPVMLGLVNKLIKSPPKDLDHGRRVDLSSLDVFTIDDETTQDVDDGLSFDPTTNNIYIHIADPSIYTPKGEFLDKHLRGVLTSTYVPEKVSHMFPESLTIGSMSIAPMKANKCLTFSLNMNPETGVISNFKITPTIIRNIHRLTYDQVDALLSGTPITPSILKTTPNLQPHHIEILSKLSKISKERQLQRIKNGAFSFQLPRPKLRIQNDGNSIDLKVEFQNKSISQILVSEMMIMAGECSGRFCSEHAIPVFYRTQQPPKIPPNVDLKSIHDQYSPIVADLLMARFFTAACMEVEPQPHFALNLERYVQVTSPIRRYADLVAHTQIKAFLRGDPFPYHKDELQSLTDPITSRSRMAKELERRSTRFWILKWVQQNARSRVFGAYVLETVQDTQNECYATLFIPDLTLRTYAPFTRIVTVGELVSVKVKSVSPYEDRFMVADALATTP